MQTSKIEMSAGGALSGNGARERQFRSRATLLGGLTGLLAVSLGVLQLQDAELRSPVIWLAGNQIVLFGAMLILLYVEWRKRAAILRSLAEAQQRLAYTVESGSFGVWEWDVASEQVICDGSWLALVGEDRRERIMTAAEMAASVHPDDLPGVTAAVNAMLRGKTRAYDIEHRVRTLQGHYIWARSRGKVMQRGTDGRAQRVFGIVADIGERVALEEAQRQSRALLLSQQADLLQCFHIAALHWGDAYMILPQIVELAAKALSADRVSLWYYGDDGNGIVCADCYESSGGQHCSGMVRDATHLPADLRKLSADGANGDDFFVDEPAASARAAMFLPILRSGTRIGVLEIECAGRAAGWPTEERLYAVMISNLIMLLLERDAHQEAQNILEERERQLRLVTDSVPALIAYVDTEERLEFHNCAYYVRFGQAAQPAIGRSLREILGDPMYRRTRKRVRRTLDGSEVSFRSIYRTADGARHIDFVRLVPHVSESGEVLGFYALLLDVTDEWQSEEKLKRALEQMERAIRARDAFLATVSHELRTPLNAIIGFNSLMLEKDCSPEERTRYHTFARDAGQALLTQVNDLLDMAKIEAGKVELAPLDFDLPLLIESVVNVSLSMAQSQGLQVGTRISKKLRRWVHGDPVRLRQILTNLLSNAMKFTEQGSILVSARAIDNRMVEIAVADTGVGIPPDRLEAIFEKFSQADISITRRFGGTGLGLAICRSLARMMGGEVSVESTLGSGSVFSIIVPLQAGKACAAAVAAPPRRMRSGRILVVEDQEANAILAKVLLQHMGHDVELAANGVEALNKLMQRKFDVVLMDLEMPLMGGLEATRRIRAMAMPTRNMPVIAMSASAYATDIARCTAAGMDGHIAKPIGSEALATMLERWLPERRANSRTGNAAAAASPISKLVAEVGYPAAIQVATAFECALLRRLRLFRAERLDLPAIKIEVHNLAGISTTLGFNELTEIARMVEARFGQGGQVEELVPPLIAKCEAAERVLQKLLHEPVAGPV